ncbi:PDT-domain-containing protein [Hypoxylon sp. NC1633]|nr:PDT-domain-containing protein [Hypoxylon sp. NC1633]
MESSSAQKQGSSADPGVAPAEESSGKQTVCFLGPIGSYTHQATADTFPTKNFDLVPVQTITDVFATVQSRGTAYGVVPFENSSNGAVVPTLDQFADRDGLYPDLCVCAEIYLDVHHCLVGPAPPSSTFPLSTDGAPPPPPLSHVKRVYSHPQAFGQCARFLGQNLRGVETVDVSSTSRAAEMARDDASGSSAAISSATAAALLGLDVLARNVEDREDNTTRFFVLRRAGHDGISATTTGLEVLLTNRRIMGGKGGREDEDGDRHKGEAAVYAQTKTLASFTVPHAAPGALADVLECFRRARLNLTSIGSRPSLARPFQYIFFVEFEGHRADDPEGRVEDALRSVALVARSCRWLGSWVKMR